jgi:hypothetical protein
MLSQSADHMLEVREAGYQINNNDYTWDKVRELLPDDDLGVSSTPSKKRKTSAVSNVSEEYLDEFYNAAHLRLLWYEAKTERRDTVIWNNHPLKLQTACDKVGLDNWDKLLREKKINNAVRALDRTSSMLFYDIGSKCLDAGG